MASPSDGLLCVSVSAVLQSSHDLLKTIIETF